MNIRGLLSFFIVLLLTTTTVFAQTTDDSEYEASMEGWLVSIEEAYQQSQKEGKPILANFTGSDWCGWCIRLKKEVFETKEFQDWAAKNVILLELDFPRRFQLPEAIQQQNNGLAQALNVSGYPTIWVFDLEVNRETNQSQLNTVARSGYVNGGAAAWIADMEAKMGM